ncbi:peptidylprolyl isomerase PrsA [Streptococcus ictaluri]|nr:peptidylprolyl isomerase PrsA [Streptococcus ictaluri]
MKKTNKLLVGIVTLASVVTLAACNSTSNNTNVITMKGDTITVSDFFNEAKHSTTSQQTMLNLVLTRVFEAQYGKKVSNKEVDKAYNKTAEQYGSSFSNALAGAGLTPESYKGQIRTTMLVEYAVKEMAKKDLTEANYKKAFEAYSPKMTTQVITLDSEEAAKTVLGEAKTEGADFAAIAKEKTTAADKKIDYSFDSGSSILTADVIKAATGLKEGDVSEVISVLDPATYQSKFYIVKVTKKAEKKSDWKHYKKRLKDIILDEKTKDTNFQNKVIAKELDKANVKIKDQAFANILAQYASTDKSGQTGKDKNGTKSDVAPAETPETGDAPAPSEEAPASEPAAE